jgi:hypothetical protein
MGEAVYFLASPGHAIPVEEKTYNWEELDEPEGFSKMGEEKVSVEVLRQENIILEKHKPNH